MRTRPATKSWWKIRQRWSCLTMRLRPPRLTKDFQLILLITVANSKLMFRMWLPSPNCPIHRKRIPWHQTQGRTVRHRVRNLRLWSRLLSRFRRRWRRSKKLLSSDGNNVVRLDIASGKNWNSRSKTILSFPKQLRNCHTTGCWPLIVGNVAKFYASRLPSI